MNQKISNFFPITTHLGVGIEEFETRRVVALVDDRVVATCRYALILTKGEDTAEFTNMDELIEKRAMKEFEARQYLAKEDWTIEQEVQVHASNLQAWAENDYDPCLLDSKIAKPLLRELCKVDESAKRRFQAIVLESFMLAGKELREFLWIQYYNDLYEVMNVVILKDFLARYQHQIRVENCIVPTIPQKFSLKHADLVKDAWDSLDRTQKILLIDCMQSDLLERIADLVDLGLDEFSDSNLGFHVLARVSRFGGYITESINHLVNLLQEKCVAVIKRATRAERLKMARVHGKIVIELAMQAGLSSYSFQNPGFAFKVVNGPAKITKVSAFHPVTKNALQRVMYHVRKTTVVNKKEHGPFACFETLEHARRFTDETNGDYILYCFIIKSTETRVWKKNAPSFERNEGGKGYHVVSEGITEKSLSECESGTILADIVIPLRVIEPDDQLGQVQGKDDQE
jgi:hypothetical protein